MRCDVHFHPPPSRGSDLVRWVCSHITTHIQTHHPTSSSPPACLPCCVLLDLFTQFLPERLCAQDAYVACPVRDRDQLASPPLPRVAGYYYSLALCSLREEFVALFRVHTSWKRIVVRDLCLHSVNE
ncbi:uncharacterized protein [Physcomitrium patens]|uniref:uncharacterized protein n=1 Tax=Physcomitrium patens TaxID=3218 RepID=UPI003CCCBC61